MSHAAKKNAPRSATTSKTAPPKTPVAVEDLLREEIATSRAAMTQTMRNLKTDLRNAVHPQSRTPLQLWGMTGAAVAAGFLAASRFVSPAKKPLPQKSCSHRSAGLNLALSTLGQFLPAARILTALNTMWQAGPGNKSR